jgi:hypothetical protein
MQTNLIGKNQKEKVTALISSFIDRQYNRRKKKTERKRIRTVGSKTHTRVNSCHK